VLFGDVAGHLTPVLKTLFSGLSSLGELFEVVNSGIGCRA